MLDDVDSKCIIDAVVPFVVPAIKGFSLVLNIVVVSSTDVVCLVVSSDVPYIVGVSVELSTVLNDVGSTVLVGVDAL